MRLPSPPEQAGPKFPEEVEVTRGGNFRVAKEWRKWAVRFTDAKTRRIARLVRNLGNDYLEEEIGSQVTISMLQTLRYH